MAKKTDWKKLYDEGHIRWERAANHVARQAIPIVPCRQCGYPVVEGYQCDNLDCPEPENP